MHTMHRELDHSSWWDLCRWIAVTNCCKSWTRYNSPGGLFFPHYIKYKKRNKVSRIFNLISWCYVKSSRENLYANYLYKTSHRFRAQFSLATANSEERHASSVVSALKRALFCERIVPSFVIPLVTSADRNSSVAFSFEEWRRKRARRLFRLRAGNFRYNFS